MPILSEQIQVEAAVDLIRSKITGEMKAQGYTLTSLSKAMGVNRGMLSRILNGNPTKPIPIKLLDVMAQTFCYPEGWLYEDYVQECFHDGKGHWRRIKAFLIRCLELHHMDLIDEVLVLLLEDPLHLQDIFMLGEELYAQGKMKESIIFFKCVAENELKQHSERFAISHYKWFRAELGQELNVERSREAALRFTPYRNRLPEHYQLDGLLQLANVYFILQNWENVKHIADEMQSMALVCLRRQQERAKKGLPRDESFVIERPLVVYYGQSFLLKGNAFEKQGNYKQALTYTALYEDLSWFDGLDESGLREVERLRIFAEANRLNLHILMGNFEHLQSYIDFLDRHPDERLPGLLTILEAANQYRYNIDRALAYFHVEIEELSAPGRLKSGYYQYSFNINRRANFLYQLAIYFLQQGQAFKEKGLDCLLQALQSSISSNNMNLSISCAAWFEINRSHADDKQKEIYESIMKGVLKHAQMGYGVGRSYSN